MTDATSIALPNSIAVNECTGGMLLDAWAWTTTDEPRATGRSCASKRRN